MWFLTRSNKIKTQKPPSWEPDSPFWKNPHMKLKILSDVWCMRCRTHRLLLPLAVLLIAALACNMPGFEPGNGGSDEIDHTELDAIMQELGISIDEVMEDPEVDERPETLELLGAPDAFTLQWQELQGQIVRWEEWSYFDFESRFDFVDGVLLWVLDIEPASSGSIFAHTFNPLDFEFGMTLAEVQGVLPYMTMTEFDLDEVDIPGGEVVVGDQIILGFDDDGLVYVQTFILEPEEPLDD
jgi:hypothetical protein